MKKRFVVSLLLTFGLALTSQTILRYESKLYSNNVQVAPETNQIQSSTSSQDITINEKLPTPKDQNMDTQQVASNSTDKSVKSSTSLSRGGSALNKSQINKSSTPEKKQNTYSTKPELVDWWKSGRNIFSIGTVAEVTDLYTGKTFKVKRTMGTNHADSEAVSKKDTEIIKSIWGGFSWARRPIILTINGKKYAASMSAMPHAGLDSAPLNAIVNNRAGGYGRGENLDAIKGNGMDGHFDIHFLNSTRHMDGKKDPEHQAAILKAAGK